MEVVPLPSASGRNGWVWPSTHYRVTIWEQPVMEGVDPEVIGWGEMTFDLVDIENVHEAIRWAEKQLTLNKGPYSRSGTPVHDREYVLSVKVLDSRVSDEGQFVQIAGWDPTIVAEEGNLRRATRP